MEERSQRMNGTKLGRAALVVVIVCIPFLWPVGLYLGWKWYRESR
jgi:hypothetical protein